MKRVKILFLAANPSDTIRLRINDERRRLETEIRKSPNRDALDLIYEPAIRPGDLVEVLRRHRPDVVHFGGHGSEANEIILEADDGSSRLVGTDALVELFRIQGASVRVVVLNACYSREQAQALTHHVDCAIGMSRAVPDATAIGFASALYQGLAYGESVRTAFDSSLLQIRLLAAPGLHRPAARDLGRVEDTSPAPVPELIVRPGADVSRLILVTPSEVAERPTIIATPPPVKPGPVEARRGARRARPSRGLPIDRDLGGLVGLLLVVVGGLGLLAKLAVAAGIRLEGVPVLPSWFWPTTGVVLAFGILLLVPWPYRRSRLLRPEALRLRNDDPAHFRARDEDVERLIGCCRNHPLTCLVGESGAGKSAMVRVGLGCRWPADAPLTPILIDQWGHDWIDGPHEAMAEAVRRLGRRQGKFLLIFDQLDDYQVLHRQHFLEDGGAVWKGVDAIVAANPFWANVRQLVAERRVHCLFVTRSDASIGLDSVKVFSPSRDYELGRLSVDDVRPLLDELTEPGPAGEVISDPGFGWDKLKERVARDLAVDGLVLPIQMRVALQALRYLPDLTVASYERAGGLRGLEALAIERQVAEVATALRLDKKQVLDLLLALVDRQKQKTVARPEDELVASVAQRSDGTVEPTLVRALGMFEDREVVRRTVAGGGGAWVLDHDYLWRGVVDAERRADRWQVMIRQAYRAWDEARGQLVHRWWTGLLEPWKQGVLLYHRLRGRLRYGEARGFAVRSLLRFLPYLVLGIATWGVAAWEADRWATATARELLRGIGGTGKIAEPEMIGLRELAIQTQSVRWKFLEFSLSTPESADRSRFRCEAIARSTVGLDEAMRDRVVRDLIVAKMADEDADWKVRLTSLRLGLSLYASDVDGNFRSVAPAVYCQSVAKLHDPSELICLQDAFATEAAKFDVAQATEVAAQLLAALKQSTDTDQLEAFSFAISDVAVKLDATRAAEVAAQLIAVMKQATDPRELGSLALAMHAVADRLDANQAAEVAAQLIAALEHSTEPSALLDLTQAWAAVADRLDATQAATQAAEVAAQLLAAIEQTTDPKARFELPDALSSVAAKLDAIQAAELAAQLLAAIEQTTDPYLIQALSLAMPGVAAKLDAAQATEVAAQLLAAVEQTTKPTALLALSQAWAAVADRLDANQAATRATEVAAQLIAALEQSTEPSALLDLTQAWAAVADRLDATQASIQAAEVAAQLLAALEQPTNWLALQQLLVVLSEVAAKLDKTQATELAEQLLAALVQTTDSEQLEALSLAMPWAAAKLDVAETAEVAAQLLKAIKQTSDPDQLRVYSTLFSSFVHPASAGEISEVFRRCIAVKRAYDVLRGGPGYDPEQDWLPTILEKLPGRIDDRELMNFLKSPECVGPVQAATVGRLGRQVNQDFHGNVWEVVQHRTYATYARTPYVPPQPLSVGEE